MYTLIFISGSCRKCYVAIILITLYKHYKDTEPINTTMNWTMFICKHKTTLNVYVVTDSKSRTEYDYVHNQSSKGERKKIILEQR